VLVFREAILTAAERVIKSERATNDRRRRKLAMLSAHSCRVWLVSARSRGECRELHSYRGIEDACDYVSHKQARR